MKPIKIGAILVLTAVLLGCGTGSLTGGTETGNPDDTSALVISNSINSVSSVLSSFIRQGFSAVSTGSGLCAGSGEGVTVTTVCSDAAHTSSTVEDFSKGCDAGNNTTALGKRYSSWFNMGDLSCSSATGQPYFSRAFRGTGAREIVSTDVIPESGVCGTPAEAITMTFSSGETLKITACAELDYSNYASEGTVQSVMEQLTIHNEKRLRFNADGTTLYDHTISTETPLTIKLAKDNDKNFPTQTISSGAVTVVQNIDNYTVKNTFQDIMYDYNTCKCHPVSGTVQVIETDNATGKSLGEGTVTFKAATTGTCDDYDAVFDGNSVTLSLGSCNGS